MYHHLLVPIDNTDLATTTIGQAVEFARSLGARITFFYAQTGHAVAPQDDNATTLLASYQDFSYTYKVRAKELLTKAESAARAQGVPCSSATVVSDAPYSAILAAAQAGGCDLIFMASRGSRDAIGMMPSAQTVNVLANTQIPVLFSAPANSSAPARAIETIQYEHRSLTAVLHAWLHMLKSAEKQGTSPDVPLMSAMIQYIQNFSITLHDAKEQEYLFCKLRERTSALNAELDELERQHERGAQLVAGLAALVGRFADGRGIAREIEQAVATYANFIWEHMGREEGVILPAAQRFLTDDDWREINRAFSENQDPLSGSDSGNGSDAEFQRLFALLANLPAAPTH